MPDMSQSFGGPHQLYLFSLQIVVKMFCHFNICLSHISAFQNGQTILEVMV